MCLAGAYSLADTGMRKNAIDKFFSHGGRCVAARSMCFFEPTEGLTREGGAVAAVARAGCKVRSKVLQR